MVFQSVPETAEINHIFSLNAQIVQNTHYAKRPGGYGLADLQNLADAIDPLFLITFVTDCPPEAIYLRTEVRGLEFENDQVATAFAGTGAGTDASPALPNNVTFAIKKLSGLTGRSARGRVFWIGIPRNKTSLVNENLLDATYAGLIVEDIDFVRSTIEGLAGWDAVLVSRVTGGFARPFGVTFPWLTTSNTDLIVDTHRGRLPS